MINPKRIRQAYSKIEQDKKIATKLINCACNIDDMREVVMMHRDIIIKMDKTHHGIVRKMTIWQFIKWRKR